MKRFVYAAAPTAATESTRAAMHTPTASRFATAVALFYLAAMMPFASGCSDGDVTGPDPRSANMIHFEPSTLHHPTDDSKATISAMRGSSDGFIVWATATDAGTGSGWWSGIDGVRHIYDGSVWCFDATGARAGTGRLDARWPTDGQEYPIDFYAIFPGGESGALTVEEDDAALTVSATVTVDPTAVPTDILASQQHVRLKPYGGHQTMTFHHILSRVHLVPAIAPGHTAFIQGLAICNVGDMGTYTLTGIPGWSTPPTSHDSDYTYFGTYRDTPSGNLTILYAPAFAGGETTAFPAASTAVPSVAATGLMLVPQNDISRTWGGTEAPDDDESYVSMIYRMERDGVDMVGFTRAGEHPAFEGSLLAEGGYPAAAPLLVKVGWPFTPTWLPGKSYTYEIPLGDEVTDGAAEGGGLSEGAAGGYLIDPFYYDHYGNRTDLVVGDDDGDGICDDPTLLRPVSGIARLAPSVVDWGAPEEF
ncbi:MAG: fimbrillin family protein [Alistipes sp.]|jgi:hypothetical protein|nr:fimbrillin family protein [Alistipes sp.]